MSKEEAINTELDYQRNEVQNLKKAITQGQRRKPHGFYILRMPETWEFCVWGVNDPLPPALKKWIYMGTCTPNVEGVEVYGVKTLLFVWQICEDTEAAQHFKFYICENAHIDELNDWLRNSNEQGPTTRPHFTGVPGLETAKED